MDWLDRLKAMKSNSKLTTREIAVKSSIPEPTLEKLFSGQTKDPKLSTIQAVVSCLGFSLDDLEPLAIEKKSTILTKVKTVDKTFGGQLKLLRLERGLSQDELASILGTSKQVISRYETNQRVPKISSVNLYAQILNVPLTFLLEGTTITANQTAENDFGLSDSNPQSLDSRLIDIIEIYNDINEEGREKLVDYASDLKTNPRYKKESQLELDSKNA